MDAPHEFYLLQGRFTLLFVQPLSFVSFWISVLVRFFRTIIPLPVEDEQEHSGSQAGANLDTPSDHNPTISEAVSAPIPSSSTPTRPDHRPSQRHAPPESGTKRAGP